MNPRLKTSCDLAAYEEANSPLKVAAAVSGEFEYVLASRQRKLRDIVYSVVKYCQEKGYTVVWLPSKYTTILVPGMHLVPMKKSNSDFVTAKQLCKARFQKEKAPAEKLYDTATAGTCRFCGQAIFWTKQNNRPKPVNKDGTIHTSTCPRQDRVEGYRKWLSQVKPTPKQAENTANSLLRKAKNSYKIKPKLKLDFRKGTQ